jgi:hypothetical protein
MIDGDPVWHTKPVVAAVKKETKKPTGTGGKKC